MRRRTSVILFALVFAAVRSPASAQERASATIREAASVQQPPDPGVAAPPAPTEPDTLLNGTMIGLGVGFATGFFGWAAFNAKETASGPLWDSEAVALYSSMGMIGAGIGAGVGAIVDAIRKPPRRVAPSVHPTLLVAPIYGPQRRAVVVSITY